MRCLSDEQIAILIEATQDSRCEAWHAHVETCAECRQRVAVARDEAALIRDVRELRESRKRVKPLLDGVFESSRSAHDPARKSSS